MRPPTPILPNPKTANELLNMYFLEIRCHLLEVAAAFDRIERAPGGETLAKDPRLARLYQALEVLKEPGADRAKRFLDLLSEDEV